MIHSKETGFAFDTSNYKMMNHVTLLEHDLHFFILVLEKIRLLIDPQQIMMAPDGTLNNSTILVFMQF